MRNRSFSTCGAGGQLGTCSFQPVLDGLERTRPQLTRFDEILQYGRGAARLEELRARTDELATDEGRLKRVASRNAAASSAGVLLLDVGMLLLATWLAPKQAPFAAVLIPTVALMGSFGPVIALASLGSTLQATFAASNLDSMNEAVILRALARERKGRTVLLVSHRASTMRIADTVVSVERGRVS